MKKKIVLGMKLKNHFYFVQCLQCRMRLILQTEILDKFCRILPQKTQKDSIKFP